MSFKWQRGDFADATISAMKRYVITYLKWREIGKDTDGKEITPEHTKYYEEYCKILKDIGEKL